MTIYSLMKWFALTFVLSLTLSSGIFSYIFGGRNSASILPVPYTNSTLTLIEEHPYEFILGLSFTKTDCIFQELLVTSTHLGFEEDLNWYDTDGPKGNREVGDHNIIIVATKRRPNVDDVTVTTRHACEVVTEDEEGKEVVVNALVDKTFGKIDFRE